ADVLDPHHLGALARRLQFLALTEVGGEGHHLATVFGLEPLEDDRGVEPARIGEDDLVDVFAHALAMPWMPPRGRGLESARTLFKPRATCNHCVTLSRTVHDACFRPRSVRDPRLRGGDRRPRDHAGPGHGP